MKMIPDYVEKFPSRAEKTIHGILSECSHMEGYALHSLNVAHHKTKRWGEIDFVLITSFGLLALEVKGMELHREGGTWFVRDPRDGSERQLKESPYDQARTAVFPLIDRLKEKGLHIPTFGWGLVTPECDRLPVTPEFPAEMQADFEDCRDAKRFTKWLRKLEKYWEERPGGRAHLELDGRGMDALVKILRPNFDLAVPLGKRQERIGEEMKRFTEEQFSRLDDINENERILCRGGAGSGKTFLAMEVMRRETALGRSCLYVARSQPLVDFLKQDREGLDLLSFEELCSRSVAEPWDVLVIDEGQDLLGMQFLEVLDSALKGGLEKGRWRWFMDDHRQAGFHDDVDPEAIQMLDPRGVTLQRLRVNCRNTSEIVHFTQMATGADIGEAKINGSGPIAEFPMIDEGGENASILDRINRWIREDVSPQGIVVLTCADGIDEDLLAKLPKHVRMHTVLDFKGLEADCVAVIGMGSASDLEDLGSHLYTGLTRARMSIWLAIPAAMREAWNEMTAQNLEKMMGVQRG